MDQARQLTEGRSDAEHLLREFFRAEMPKPWPPFRAPAADYSLKSSPRLSLGHSHVGLAASVLLLVAGLVTAGIFLRTDAGPESDIPAMKGANKPAVPGKEFRKPPATLPAPAKPDETSKDRPFSHSLPPVR